MFVIEKEYGDSVDLRESDIMAKVKWHFYIDSCYICPYCPDKATKFDSFYKLRSHLVQHKTQQVLVQYNNTTDNWPAQNTTGTCPAQYITSTCPAQNTAGTLSSTKHNGCVSSTSHSRYLSVLHCVGLCSVALL